MRMLNFVPRIAAIATGLSTWTATQVLSGLGEGEEVVVNVVREPTADNTESEVVAQQTAPISDFAPDPVVNPPPWIQTMTANFSEATFAGVHTLRFRQSSLVGPAPRMPRPVTGGCSGAGPGSIASRSRQGGTAAGFRKRGAEANGQKGVNLSMTDAGRRII